MERHGLVWLTETGWQSAIQTLNPHFHKILKQWSARNWPVVVRRSDPTTPPEEIYVGISLSPVQRGFKEKIGFKILKEQISKYQQLLPLEDIISYAPLKWQAKLHRMVQDFKNKGISVYVYGSLAWQAMTEQGYLTQESDVDILLFPKTRLEYDTSMSILKNYGRYIPLDGEMCFPSGHSVAWKECIKAQIEFKLVIAKKNKAVELLSIDILLQTFPNFSKISHLALKSLYEELALYPKPGLVSFMDSGSHTDMNAITFMKSLCSLRYYFNDIAYAGFQDASFDKLKKIGILAEAKMMHATCGVNTHRGAIFSLGLLCAAVSRTLAVKKELSTENIRSNLLASWGNDLIHHSENGSLMGARKEAALGFPTVFEIGLPVLHKTLKEGRSYECAKVDVLFALMAQIYDTNIMHRGGNEGANIVKRSAEEFILNGGTAHPTWKEKALFYHRLFIENRLSPGGAADLLAATCFIFQTTGTK